MTVHRAPSGALELLRSYHHMTLPAHDCQYVNRRLAALGKYSNTTKLRKAYGLLQAYSQGIQFLNDTATYGKSIYYEKEGGRG
jgi:hypothetical protein